MCELYWIIPSNSDWSSPKVLVVWKVTVKWHCRFLYIFSRWIPDPIFSVCEWKEAYFLFPLSQTQPAIWKPSRVLLLASLPVIKILQAEFYLSNDENTFCFGLHFWLYSSNHIKTFSCQQDKQSKGQYLNRKRSLLWSRVSKYNSISQRLVNVSRENWYVEVWVWISWLEISIWNSIRTGL